MRCPTCGLKVAGAPAHAPVHVCPRCGQPLEQRTDSYPTPVVGPPGQPRFTLPTLTAVQVQPGRRAAQSREYVHGDLHRKPPYPAVSAVPSSRAPLIVGALSLVVIAALLLGAGLLWRGSLRADREQVSTAPTPSGKAHTGGVAVTTPTPTPFPGTVLYHSSLEGTAGGWVNDSHCSYKADGYHISGAYLCYAPVTQQSDVDITVTVKQLSGPYSLLYGIVFRASGNGNYYLFGIDGNGKWTFAKLSNSRSSYLIQPKTSTAIKGTLNQSNTLQVKAAGSHFEFFVNGVQIGQAEDSAYSSGLIGLTSEGGVEVVYANISVVKP
ncbi:MAG: hypothetical protein ACLQUY_00875 [Ktedonobacterales bacterium]